MIGLQRTAGNAAVTALLEQSLAESEDRDETSPVLDIVGKGQGRPLDPGLRDEMEIRLGEDFKDVRIHTDAPAAASATAVAARAYTVGNEVVLGDAAPALDTPEGKHTLAHELTHVVQQRQGPVAGTPTGGGIAISDPSDRFEQAAEANARRVMEDRSIDASPGRDSSAASGAGVAMQRQTDVEDYEDETAEYQEEAAEYQEEAAEYQEEAAEATEEGAESAEEELEEGGEEEEAG